MQMHYNSNLNYSDNMKHLRDFFKTRERDINITIVVTNIVPYMYKDKSKVIISVCMSGYGRS